MLRDQRTASISHWNLGIQIANQNILSSALVGWQVNILIFAFHSLVLFFLDAKTVTYT